MTFDALGPRRCARSQVTFDAFIPERGFLPGVGLWLPSWLARKRGRPFIFEAFLGKPVGRPDAATAWAGVCMSKPHLEVAWAWLLSPLYSGVDLKALHITLHGPRHLLPEMTRQFGAPHFSKSDRNELGRWAGSEAADDFGRRKDSDMADLYAREGPAHDSELRVRLKAIEMGSAFIGGRPWTAVVPSHVGAGVSFSFLAQPDQAV